VLGTDLTRNRGAVMAKAKTLIFFFLLLVGLDRAVFSQEITSMFMAGMNMELGMPRSEVMSKLKENYNLQPLEKDPDQFLIFDKRSHVSPFVGNIAFEQDKLSYISRGWGSFEGGEAIKLAKSLASILANLNDEGGTVAVVKSTQRRQPDFIINEISFSVGNKTVDISVAESSQFETTVTLRENIRFK
jgi:hypothetical protein